MEVEVGSVVLGVEVVEVREVAWLVGGEWIFLDAGGGAWWSSAHRSRGKVPGALYAVVDCEGCTRAHQLSLRVPVYFL